MIRKTIVSITLCIALLFLMVSLVSAQEPGQAIYQMDTGTATAMPPAVEATPVSELPLSDPSAAQSGTCPMMSGSGMTGMNMGNMSGMQGMSGMGMNGMSGMQGMGGMTNMSGMAGMNMTGINGTMMPYSTPWYSNPWLMLGWVLLVLVILAILAGIVLGVQTLRQRSVAIAPVEKS